MGNFQKAMDIVGALYSTIPSNMEEETAEEGVETQPMMSAQNEEYFFFSDGHSEMSDSEVVVQQPQEVVQ